MYFILLSSSNRKYDPIVKGYVMKQCMYFYVFMFSLRIYVSEHPLDFLYKRESCYYVGYCDNPHSNIKALCTETVHLASVAILKWMAHIHNQTLTNKTSWNIGKMDCNIQTTISKLQTFLVTTVQLLTWRHAAVVKLVNIRIWIMFAQSVNDNSLLM